MCKIDKKIILILNNITIFGWVKIPFSPSNRAKPFYAAMRNRKRRSLSKKAIASLTPHADRNEKRSRLFSNRIESPSFAGFLT